jgi:hypothetical protein
VRRKGNGRIPERLWALAVRLAKTHGVSRTAVGLGVDYYSLKKRVAAATGQPPSSSAAFVELPGPVMVGKQCLLELDHGAGVTMRVQLVGYDTAEVTTLACALWTD